MQYGHTNKEKATTVRFLGTRRRRSILLWVFMLCYLIPILEYVHVWGLHICVTTWTSRVEPSWSTSYVRCFLCILKIRQIMCGKSPSTDHPKQEANSKASRVWSPSSSGWCSDWWKNVDETRIIIHYLDWSISATNRSIWLDATWCYPRWVRHTCRYSWGCVVACTCSLIVVAVFVIVGGLLRSWLTTAILVRIRMYCSRYET